MSDVANAEGATAQVAIDVDLGPEGKLSFPGRQDALNWIAAEEQFWSWAKGKSARRSLPLTDDPTGDLFNSLAIARGALQTEPQPALSKAVAAIQGYVRTGLSSQNPRAQFIDGLRQSNDEAVAFAALAHCLGGKLAENHSREQRKVLRKGAIAIDSFDSGIAAGLPSAISASIEGMLKHYHQAISAAAAEGQAILADISATKDQLRAECATLKTEAVTHWEAVGEKINTGVKAALETLSNTHKAYTEQMKLRASVDYWSAKAEAHENKAGQLRRKLVTFAWLAGLVLVCALSTIIYLAIRYAGTAGPATPLLFFGLGLVLTTALMWVARILVRLFLSEHHLGIDARERATMAMTYLALTNEGKVSETDRALVLAPLFRPTTDGIVKDDAAPDVSLAGQLSRIAQPR